MNIVKNIKKNGHTFIFGIIFFLLLIYITHSTVKIITVSKEQEDQNICVPIIMYHQVKDRELGKDVISSYEFESDLIFLSEHNYTTITMSQLIDYVYGGIELPENPIILTFDDGYYSIYKNVFPLIKEYDMKIVLSIIGKSTDDFSKEEENNNVDSHLTWNQIYEMSESGLVEIQNHSYNLHKISGDSYGSSQKDNESFSEYKSRLKEDVKTLQDKIVSVLDFTPNTFAYPYGKYNDNTDTILKSMGFKASLSVTYGVNLISENDRESLFGLKRICREHNQTIAKVIEDGMETLKYLED